MFAANEATVQQLNALDDGASYSLDASPFADMTVHEFKQKVWRWSSTT